MTIQRSGFHIEDVLARTKFHEAVTGRQSDPNPGRTEKRMDRLAGLRTALSSYTVNNLKEFMFGLREDA